MLLNCGAGKDSRVPSTARRPNQSIPKEINPENSMERLMLKVKSVGAQYATEEQWRNNSRNNEETELKRKQHPAVVCLVMEVKSDALKSNIAKEPGVLGPLIKVN